MHAVHDLESRFVKLTLFTYSSFFVRTLIAHPDSDVNQMDINADIKPPHLSHTIKSNEYVNYHQTKKDAPIIFIIFFSTNPRLLF